MGDIKKTVQKSNSDDSRRMETHVEEVVLGATTERVTTVKEEHVPMTVKRVVREKIVPVVASRIIESYDDNGNIVDTQHEVVADEAAALKLVERDVTAQAIAKAVEDAIRRSRVDNNIPHVEELPDEEEEVVTMPRPAAKAAPKSAFKMIQERNEPKKGIEFEFDGNTLLYTVVAIEAALIVYLTVLKGWLLN